MSDLFSGEFISALAEQLAAKLSATQPLPLAGQRLFKVADAAEILGCTPQHVRNYIARGILPVVVFSEGGHQYVDAADIDKFIQEHKRRDAA